MLELVIALLISAVAMMIAGHLLLEAQRQTTHAAHRLLDPAITIAWKQIRADVQASSSASGSEKILTLSGHPAGNVRYRWVKDELLRGVAAGSEFDADDERVILTRVKDFGWKPRWGSEHPLIEISVSWEQTRLLGPLVAGGERQIAPKVVGSQSLVLALRGGGGDGW
ncbi:MAG: hypothetical protein GY856_35960 [bacterium]|nr:hypothetical protein [bacterium]